MENWKQRGDIRNEKKNPQILTAEFNEHWINSILMLDYISYNLLRKSVDHGPVETDSSSILSFIILKYLLVYTRL